MTSCIIKIRSCCKNDNLTTTRSFGKTSSKMPQCLKKCFRRSNLTLRKSKNSILINTCEAPHKLISWWGWKFCGGGGKKSARRVAKKEKKQQFKKTMRKKQLCWSWIMKMWKSLKKIRQNQAWSQVQEKPIKNNINLIDYFALCFFC